MSKDYLIPAAIFGALLFYAYIYPQLRLRLRNSRARRAALEPERRHLTSVTKIFESFRSRESIVDQSELIDLPHQEAITKLLSLQFKKLNADEINRLVKLSQLGRIVCVPSFESPAWLSDPDLAGYPNDSGFYLPNERLQVVILDKVRPKELSSALRQEERYFQNDLR